MSDFADSAALKIKLSFGRYPAIGPGKADLLENIKRFGSISAAAKEMKMSYRRAWKIVSLMNGCFEKPLVETFPGGVNGGGAEITEAGEYILKCYRDIEVKTRTAGKQEIAGILSRLKAPG
jgi:molybdate transport system regulatory protein